MLKDYSIKRGSSGFLVLAMAIVSFFVLAGESSASDFGLSAPAIVKADRESVHLLAADLNGDHLCDFAAINNIKSLLQIFTQNPPGQSPRFVKREETIEYAVTDMRAADLNGDGRIDLALARGAKNLAIRYQRPDGSLAPAVELEAQGVLLIAGDFDGDGSTDLLLTNQEKTIILHGASGEGIDSATPLTFFNAASAGTRPDVRDLNGDGLGDLIYLDSKRRSRVLVRYQSAPRKWSLESAIEIGDTLDLAIPRTSTKEQKKPARLAAIDSKTGELRLYDYVTQKQEPSAGKFPLAGPYFLSMDPASQSGRETLLASDLTGDGRADLAFVSPKAAEMHLFASKKGGDLEHFSTPALSDVTALAAARRPNAGALLFSLSDKEETIGVSAWNPSRAALSVPQFLDSENKPLAMTAADFDKSGRDDLLYVTKTGSKEKQTLSLAVIADPADTDALRRKPTFYNLGLEADFEPTALMAADVNGDSLCDLLIFSKYNPLALLLRQKDTNADSDTPFASYATDRGAKRGIFNKVQPAHTALADLDGDGALEMLIASENFARAYSLDVQGDMRLVAQFNGKNVASRIASVVAADLDGSGAPEVVLLDTAGQVLTIYTRSNGPDYRLARDHEIDGSRATRLLAVDANGDGRQDLALAGGDRALLYYSGMPASKYKAIWRRAPEEKDAKYAYIESLALSGDADQIAVFEGSDNLLEFFTPTPEATQAATRLFHFKVYDDEMSVARSRMSRGNTQPRALIAADINGDGQSDLIALAHDNIIYYLQTNPRGDTGK